ncbi:MAG: TonB-dependent receptor [Acidobacteriota bacterium]|nr:TonB-dependent receptor [Acidobacteriota bacterium]
MTPYRTASLSGGADVVRRPQSLSSTSPALYLLPAFVLALLLMLATSLFAEPPATVGGTVTDSFGAVVANAKIELLDASSGVTMQNATSDGTGHYRFAVDQARRYQVRATATSFRPSTSAARFVSGNHAADVDLVLAPSTVSQKIVVTANGLPTPEVQAGASIDVIDGQDLTGRSVVEQEMRLVPGVQVAATGQPGSQTALRVRGGPTDSTKVLVDGIPVNDIGGFVDLSQLSATGIGKAEIFRGPNSALFGSDAMAGVVSLTTTRGTTPLPELTYQADGGSFDTNHQQASLGGAWRKLDYFTAASRFNTQNDTPNSQAHNTTYAGNLGWQVAPNTELRATVHRSASAFNLANAYDMFLIPDTGVAREHDTDFGVTLQSRFTEHWHGLVRYAGMRYRYTSNTYGATGIPYDPYDTGYPVYLGKEVTIHGANGYSTTGQAILQYSSDSTSSPLLTNKNSIYAQTDYRFSEKLTALFGFRYEAEDGYSGYFDEGYGSLTRPGERGNYSYTMQLNGGLWNRLFYTVGSGLERNAVFGFAATPRASLAYFIAPPRQTGVFNGTRLSFNFGKGIKEPTIGQEANSLYRLAGSTFDEQYGIKPFLAEQSRTYDGGVQQTLFGGRARLGLTYFHNEFNHLAEYVPYAGLVDLGVPQSVLDKLGPYAYVNTLAYRAQGSELKAEVRVWKNLTLRGNWSYTDAKVQQSFSSSVLSPAYNPNIPGIAIGAYSPLVGARPFRVAPHTASFAAEWNGGRWLARATGTLVSRRDDSTFLSDKDYGYSMLLPNHDLDPSYQKVDVYGSFNLCKFASAYVSVEDLLNQKYYETFGYASLPVSARAGILIRLGGESWKLR